MIRYSLAIAILWSSLIATSANADWHEVSSDHFVIYANQKEKDLGRFAERLERFHAAMAHGFSLKQAKPSPSNRVTIFIVSDRFKVRRLADSNNPFTSGFYRARAGATVAVIPRLHEASSRYAASREAILYHEYAHHFLAGMTSRVFPRWFVEGFAEFFAEVRYQPDGGIGLGAPAKHRAIELAYAPDVPLRTMLEFDGGAAASNSVYNAFYAQSWILFHYLMFAPERSGQLSQYQSLLAAGQPALDAAAGAFGDLNRLDEDIAQYEKRKQLSYLVIDGKALTIGPITIRPLRPGEAEMMPTRIQSRVGVTREAALELLPEARRVAARHPDDPAVLAALAEAEFDAGNDDAAIAAADRALAIDPNEINAHIQKGYALYRKVQEGVLPRESWQEVRNQFIRANKVENDHPIPLLSYYLTYLQQGEQPTKTAVDGLEWAMVLAPFDSGLRWMVAQQMVTENRLNDAAQTLAPLAYSPHRGEHTERARQLLKDVEARINSELEARNNQ